MTKDNVMLVGSIACLTAIVVIGIAVWLPCWIFGAWCS